ncbi:MAG: hypothetical protein WD738_02220 [Pirellulales bacterium]
MNLRHIAARLYVAARPVVPVLLLLSAMSAPIHAATIYNASADFSYAANPNGVWSYNVGLIPLPFVQSGWGGVPGEMFWATTLAGTVPPAWGKAATTPAGTTDWLPGDVIVHASNSGSGGADQGNITWTSPGAGYIDISGKAWDAVHSPGRDDAWSLSLDGDVLASRPGIVGVQRGDAAADFANNLLPLKSLANLTVQAGDVLKFEVQKAAGCCGHFSGLELTVSLVPEPPAALAASLMLTSLLSSILWRRRSSSHGS